MHFFNHRLNKWSTLHLDLDLGWSQYVAVTKIDHKIRSEFHSDLRSNPRLRFINYASAQTGAVSFVHGFIFARVFLSVGDGAVRQMRTSLRLPKPTRVSDRKKAPPLSESGGAGLLEVVTVMEGLSVRNWLRAQASTDANFYSVRISRNRTIARSRRRNDGCRVNARLFNHSPISRSSSRPRFFSGAQEDLIRSAPRFSGRPCCFMDFFNNFSPAFAIPGLGTTLSSTSRRDRRRAKGNAQSNNLHKDLIEAQAPVLTTAHISNRFHQSSTANIGPNRFHQCAHRFVADLNTVFMVQAFNVVQRQREPNVRHHLHGDYLWSGPAVTEKGALGNLRRVKVPRSLGNQSSSVTALHQTRYNHH
jgi:hypothetical protein